MQIRKEPTFHDPLKKLAHDLAAKIIKDGSEAAKLDEAKREMREKLGDVIVGKPELVTESYPQATPESLSTKDTIAIHI